MKPWLLLDVDGVLNPWPKIPRDGHSAGPGWNRHELRPDGWQDPSKPPLPVVLSDDHATRLRDLTERAQLAWATTWVHDANRFLSPLLGLPTDLPVIEWPDDPDVLRLRKPITLGSWKTPHIASWMQTHAPEAAWLWLDDEANRRDRAWLNSWYGEPRTGARHDLRRIAHHHGLRPDDWAVIDQFITLHS